jgi:hypothetical protein
MVQKFVRWAVAPKIIPNPNPKEATTMPIGSSSMTLLSSVYPLGLSTGPVQWVYPLAFLAII